MSVQIQGDLLDDFAEMLAASKAVRAFLRVPNNQQQASRAIFRVTANESMVPVSSVTDGAAGAASFVIPGDQTRVFLPGAHCRFVGHKDMRNSLTIASAAYADEVTTVQVLEAIAQYDLETLHVRPQEPPRIVIWVDSPQITKRSQSRGDYFYSGAQMTLVMEWEAPSTYFDRVLSIDDPQGAGRAFAQLVDGVVCDLQNMAGSERPGATGRTWMDFQTIAITDGPDELDRPQQSPTGLPLWGCKITCDIGGE